MTRSLSVRLTALFTACACGLFLVAGVVLYRVLEGGLMQEQRDELTLRGAWVESLVARTQSESQWRLWLTPRLNEAAASQTEIQVWLISDDPRFNYGSAPPEIAALARAGGFGKWQPPGQAHRMLTWAHTLAADGDRPAVHLLLAQDRQRYRQTLADFRLALLTMGSGALLLVALLGYGVARWGLRPLRKLSRQAQALDPAHQSQRLALSPMPAELDDLTCSFNGALARLEAAYQQLEAFNADVAHELRTPLTNMIGQTQVMLTRRRSAPELEEALQSNLEDMERLKGIVNDMLFLARADQGATAARQADVALAAEVAKVAEFLEPLFDEAQVRLSIHGDAPCSVEVALLRRALSNLLRNAIQHSAPGDEVQVLIERSPGAVTLAVSNPGPPLDPAHLPHLFDRFYRVDSARQNPADGLLGGSHHGLGLAIVKAIAQMHRGSVLAESREGRNRFGLRLPTAA